MRAGIFGVGFGVVFGLLGCGSDDPAGAGGEDTGSDTGNDAGGDAVADTGTDARLDASDASDGADGSTGKDGFTDAEWAVLKTLGPLPDVPKDPTNKFADDAKAATLGQMLFFEKSYAGALVVGDDGSNGGLGTVGATGKVSCASCHGGPGLDDNRSKPNNVSLGIDYGTRNTPGLANASYYAWTNWAGRFDSQWSLPLAVAENPKTMKSTRLEVVHVLFKKYRTEYDAIFTPALDPRLDPTSALAAELPAVGKPGDAAFDGMKAEDKDIVNRIYANYGKAIAAYLRKLTSKNAPIDKYLGGDFTALTAGQKRGLKLFIGKGACQTCHSGPNFSDDKFYALGLPQTGPHVPATDNGRFADVPALLASPFNSDGAYSDDKTTKRLTGLVADATTQTGKFRTKSLRGVAQTAPYMHAGQHASLTAAVTWYTTVGKPTGDAGASDTADGATTTDVTAVDLSTAEIADLVDFLGSLTGDPVPTALTTDTAK